MPPAAVQTGPLERLALRGLMLAVVTVWAWTFVMVKDAVAVYPPVALLDRYSAGHHARVLVLGQLLGAVALLLCFWLLTEPPSWPPLAVWPALLVTALLATAVAYFVQTFVQQRLPAAETALLILLEAPLAAAFGILLRGERLSPLQWLGGGLMLAAVAWSAMRTTGDG